MLVNTLMLVPDLKLGLALKLVHMLRSISALNYEQALMKLELEVAFGLHQP